MKDKERIDRQEELARRNHAFKEMIPATQAVAKKVESLFARADRGPILIAWDIGNILNPVAAKQGVYGQDAMQQLVDYLAIPQGGSTLCDYRNLAREFSRDALEQEMAQPMANGRSLSLYHFIELLSVQSLKKRAEMFAVVRSECLSVAELRDQLVSRGLRSCIKKGGGRQIKRPTSPSVGLHRLVAHAERLVKYAGVLDDVFEGIEQMPPTEVDDTLLQKVETAETSAAGAIECLENVMERLTAAKGRVNRVLSARSKKKTMPVPA
jgi:hypothetical protein